MTDAANLPSQPKADSPQGGEPPVPAWVDTTDPKTDNQSVASNSPVASVQGKAKTPPASPTMEQPEVYQVGKSRDKGKILKTAGLALMVVVLTSATYFSLSALMPTKSDSRSTVSQPTAGKSETSGLSVDQLIKNKMENPTQLPAEPVVSRKGDFSLSVNGEILSWQEYENLLEYYRQVFYQDVNQSEFEKSIYKDLVKELLIQAEAKKQGIQLNQQDLVEAEADLFDISLTKNQKEEYPEIGRQIQARAYQNRLAQQLATWYRGGYIFVQTGMNADEIASKYNQTGEQYFKTKIDNLRQQAEQGASIVDLLAQMRKDEEIMKANNGSAQSGLFDFIPYSQNQLFFWEDPNFKKNIFQLESNQVSPVFVLKQPVDRSAGTWIDYGYVFIKVDQKQNNQYQYFIQWLEPALSQAQIVSNL